MSFLERAIRRGVKDAVGKAIGNAVSKAVEPKATELANKAAYSIDQATQNTRQQAVRSSGLEGAMANLERSMQGYATEAAKSMKLCPSCNKPTAADKKFCPECGARLPEQTVAQGAVCPGCHTQNPVGTKFCQECGTKLPAAIAEEQAAASRDAAVLQQWDSLLDVFPKWSCGGSRLSLDDYGDHFIFHAYFPNHALAQQAVNAYGALARQHGFRPAGQYPDEKQLFNKINGVCYNIDLEHCFEGDADCPQICFSSREPYGGFDYVKPEPRTKTSFKDLFGL